MEYIIDEIYRINDKGAKTFGSCDKEAKGKLVRITGKSSKDIYTATFLTPPEWCTLNNLRFTTTQLDEF